MRGLSFYSIRYLVAAVMTLFISGCSVSTTRERTDFNEGWRFSPGDTEEAWRPDFDDSSWRQLNLPHDWSIEGEFSSTNPATPGGGALPGGTGWYRKTFSVEQNNEGKLYYIEFDGVYRNSEVWVNGHYLGMRPYGYISFRYDLTPHLRTGAEKNVIAVRVDNSGQPNSRWYSGSGIYRNVWLVSTGTIAVDHHGTFVTTPEVNEERASLNIDIRIKNTTGAARTADIRSGIYDEDGKRVALMITEGLLLQDTITDLSQDVVIEKPYLWSVSSPYLYKVITGISVDGKKTDSFETTFGVRSFSFSSEDGFILNGAPLKILGVCNHHDLGCLGAAVNTRAIERQLEILKSMGCNAIRTSHNPPAPELLDLCDRMGFIVMDEAFDMWKKSKTPFDYSLDWDEWHERDLRDFVMRDRNHPSVFIWSIGNEIPEQWDTTGITIARELAGIVRDLDTTRPVTSGLNDPYPHNYIYRSGVLDLIGYNYHDTSFTSFPSDFPGEKFIASETNSALATRGSYDMPSDVIRTWPVRWDLPFNDGNPDYSCSSYDNCSAPWGSTHERTWRLIREHDYMSGMFIWTGFDYLGEPTPYWWPARSSYFGVIDLAGFPKDAFYFYQSEWTDNPVLHLFPHWNWSEDQTVDVWAYTNCDSVELFLNGNSLGIQEKNDSLFRVMWRVPFEPGVLTAIGKKNGTEIIRTEVKTAGEPAAIELIPDRPVITADGRDLSFITVNVLDKEKNIVPYADNLISFSVEGDAVIAGVDNGSQISHESFQASERKAFHGKCLAVIMAGRSKGRVVVTATADGLKGGSVEITLE